MSFLDFIFRLFKSDNNEHDAATRSNSDATQTSYRGPEIGSLDFSKCVYCQAPLIKAPEKRTKCKKCGDYIYVRKRPSDNKRVLLKESELNILEDQWLSVNDPEAYAEKQKVIERLSRENGTTPSKAETDWEWYKSLLNLYAQNGHWGLYRNTRLNMATFLSENKNPGEAALTYLEVYYLDLNGSNNANGFDKSMAMGLPWMYEEAVKISEESGITKENLKERFLERARLLKDKLSLPVDPNTAWSKMEKGKDK